MKKLMVLILLVGLLFSGCATTGTTPTTVSQLVDIGFVAIIIAHPEYKPEIIKAIDDINVYLEKDISYQTLIAEITNRFGGKYAPVGVLVIELLNTDKPISEDWLTMFDDQKESIRLKLNHLKMLASAGSKH